MKITDPLRVTPFVSGRLLREVRNGNRDLGSIDWTVTAFGDAHDFDRRSCAECARRRLSLFVEDVRRYLDGGVAPLGHARQPGVTMGHHRETGGPTMKKQDSRRPSEKWESPASGKTKPRYVSPKGRAKRQSARLARRELRKEVSQ
jgi:hypothetical protein